MTFQHLSISIVIILALLSCPLTRCTAEVGHNGSRLRVKPRETNEIQDRDLTSTRPIKDSFSNRHDRNKYFKERAATSIRRLDGNYYDGDPYYEGQMPYYDDDDEYYNLTDYYDDLIYYDDKMMYYEGQVDELSKKQETSADSPNKSKIALGFFLFVVIAVALVALGWKVIKYRNKKNVTNATETEMQGQAAESEII